MAIRSCTQANDTVSTIVSLLCAVIVAVVGVVRVTPRTHPNEPKPATYTVGTRDKRQLTPGRPISLFWQRSLRTRRDIHKHLQKRRRNTVHLNNTVTFHVTLMTHSADVEITTTCSPLVGSAARLSRTVAVRLIRAEHRHAFQTPRSRRGQASRPLHLLLHARPRTIRVLSSFAGAILNDILLCIVV